MPPRFSWQGRCQSRLFHMTRTMCERDPDAQDLGDAPRLSDTTALCERFVGIEDFADRSDASIIQVREEAVERAAGAIDIIRVDLQPRVDERADQPRPDR